MYKCLQWTSAASVLSSFCVFMLFLLDVCYDQLFFPGCFTYQLKTYKRMG